MAGNLGKALTSKAGIDLAGRFGQGWDSISTFGVIFRMGIWWIRGCFSRLLFGSSAGLMLLVGKNVTIRQPKYLRVGRNFIAQDNCEINCLSEMGLTFGDKVTVGSYAIIRPTNLYGGCPGVGLKIGNNSSIGPYSYIGCSGYIEIGNNVMISPRVSIYSENHVFDDPTSPIIEQGVNRSFVIIEDDCWIASHSVILAGVRIGRGSVIGAGSIVTKDVPPFSIVAGNPARVIKSRKNQ
ncbi:MAG TPA: acyltransferase [Lunatimonas sp.]|nr:acyltransferase [Lunatimonas sp.]